MATLHKFVFKIFMVNVRMYTHLAFPVTKYLFGVSKLVIFKLPMSPSNHKTCIGS